MDRTTEPVIAVLGHPIAGNAAQFAIQRAFEAMKLDWQVLSFDVDPEQLAVALDGLAVLGVEGVLVDENLAAAGTAWIRASDANAPTFDCLHRDHKAIATQHENRWLATHAAGQWLLNTIRDHIAGRQIGSVRNSHDDKSKITPERWSVAGAGDNSMLDILRPFTKELDEVAFDLERVDSLSFIVVLPQTQLVLVDWPRNEGSTLVLDLSGHSQVLAKLSEKGYRVVTSEELVAGMLSHCVQIWTGRLPPIEILREAIEEYSAV